MHLTAAQKSSSGFTAAANKPKWHSHWWMGSDKHRHTVLADSPWGGGCTVNQNTVLPERPIGTVIDDNHMQSSQAYQRSSSLRKGENKARIVSTPMSAPPKHICTRFCAYILFLNRKHCILILITTYITLQTTDVRNYIYLFPDFKVQNFWQFA